MKWNEALKDFSLYLKIERGMSMHTVNNYNLDRNFNPQIASVGNLAHTNIPCSKTKVGLQFDACRFGLPKWNNRLLHLDNCLYYQLYNQATEVTTTLDA